MALCVSWRVGFHSAARRILAREPSPPTTKTVVARRDSAWNCRLQRLLTKLTPKLSSAPDPSVMTTTVELVIVPSADTIGACVFVHHQRRSYVFGRVGEGVQRAFGTRKIRFGGTEHVFLSGPVGWDQAGGLLGYLLSIGTAIESAQEQVAQENETRRQKGLKPRPAPNHSGITVHGGDNLCHLLAAHRPVIMRQAVQVYTIEQRADPRAVNTGPLDPDWEDDALRVWKIPIQRACSPIPPKRRHSVLDETDTRAAAPSRSPPSTSSDPDVASAIVERYMFRDDESSSYTVARRAGQLDPSDVAFFKENGALRLYRHPATAGGRTTIDQNRIVWAYPRPADKPPRPASRPETLAAIKHQPLPPASYSRLSMSYIVKCHDRRGKFNPIAAAELGVLRENFKVLARGQSVKGKDGTTVTPDMVLGEMQPGMGIVIADVPGHDFVDAFIQRPEWKQADLMRHIVAMYWILRPGLSQDARIHAFIQQHAQIKHVFCASDTCPNMITHPGPAELQVQLRRIDQQRFPLLNFDNTVRYPEPPPGSPIELGRAGEKMRLMPRALLGIQAAAPFANLTVASQAIKTHVLQLAQKARAEASDTEFLARVADANRDIPNQDAEVVPLGTGSSTPNKYRNVASTLVLVPGIGNYLLDCGEGTLGQMRRGFGPEDTAAILGKLRCIVISHLHADHHLGLISVVRAWYEKALQDGSTATLAVSCTQRYCQMLQELAQVEDFGFHRLRFPSCSARTRAATDGDGGDCGDVNLTTADLGADNFGLASIQRVPVRHCWRSYATQLELTSGLRIAYSGDCRPSAAFASACRGAHLLVHECTFDDKHVDAVAKRHSTMSEALAVARDMGARRTLLTHFSQRYFRAESIWRSPQADSAAATDARHAVLLAWDLMRVRLGDFHLAARYVPAVQAHMESLGDAPVDTSGTISAGS